MTAFQNLRTVTVQMEAQPREMSTVPDNRRQLSKDRHPVLSTELLLTVGPARVPLTGFVGLAELLN